MKTCPSCKWERNAEESKLCFLCLTKLDDEKYKYDMEKNEYVLK